MLAVNCGSFFCVQRKERFREPKLYLVLMWHGLSPYQQLVELNLDRMEAILDKVTSLRYLSSHVHLENEDCFKSVFIIVF